MRGSRIFICDSDPMFASGLKQTLEDRGYLVLGVSQTGKETLVQSKKNRPDLVLIDVKLQGEWSGPETARVVYQELNIPVIFLTQVSEEITVQRINASSPYAYITKTCDIVDLVTNIEIALYKHVGEDRLRKKEAYYRGLFEKASDAILVLDAHSGRVLDANQGSCAVYGYSRNELIGRSIDTLAVDLALYQQQLQAARDGALANYRSEQYRKDGSVIILEVTSTLADFQGRPAVLSINRDVTQQVRNEEELRSMHGHLEELVSQRTEELNRANENLRLEIQQRARVEELAHLQTAALTSTANAVMIFDKDARVVWVNPAFTSITGFSCEEIIGVSPDFIRSEMNTANIMDELVANMLAGKEWHGELILRTKASECFVEAVATPVKNHMGEVTHYISIMHNVTARIRAEEALRDSENRYRLLVENSPMIIAILDQDIIRFVNQSGLAMLGIQEADQIIGKSLFDFVHPESRAEIAENFRRMIQDEQPVSYSERTWVRPDGAVYEMGISAVHISWRNKPHLQIIIQDITARKHLEETLKREAALGELEMSLNQPEELLTVLKRVMKIVDRIVPSQKGSSVVMWESRHSAFWAGFSKLESLEQHTLEHTLLSPDGPSMAVVKTGESIIVPNIAETNTPWADGIVLSGIRAFAAIPLQVKEESFGVLYVLDSAARNFSRADIEFLNQVANRIALGIAKIRLYQTLERAKDTAEEANRTKAMFLANISHELRTPLSAVISLSELLQNTALDTMQKGFVETIHLSAERLMDLITDLLDFSQIDAKKLKLENRPLEIRGMIESTLDLVSAQADAKDLFLGYTIDENVPNNIFGDPVRLGQVLTNLLNNAVKYTDSGHILLNVTISHAARAASERYPDGRPEMLLFSVRDTGSGISPERVETIFDAFTQLDISPKKKREGVGLGLTIARQLVNLMGGEIWVESKGVPGEGSIFSFTLPLIAATGPLQPFMLKNHPLLLRKQAFIASPKNVFCDTLAAQVGFWGMETRTFSTLHDLLYTLRSNASADLILLDHQLLQKRDTKLLLTIGEFASRMPVILFTTTRQNHNQDWALEAYGVLRMPLHVPQLYSMLYSLFDQDGFVRKTGQDLSTPAEAVDLSILIAEDNATLAKAISLQVEQLGFRPDRVSSGVETLLALEQQAYDIIFMDLHMPEMNGTETTRYIRASFSEKAQPYIIALTADSRPEVRGMLLEAGMNDYLAKPVKIQSLKQAIDQAVYTLRNKNGRFDRAAGAAGDGKVEVFLDEAVINDFMSAMGEKANEAMAQLIDSFLANTPPLINNIQAALDAEDWPALRMHVHSLKGNCALFGATSLVHLCKDAEMALAGGITENAEQQVQLIKQGYMRLREVLIQRKAALS